MAVQRSPASIFGYGDKLGLVTLVLLPNVSTSEDDCITKEMGISQIWRGGREKARARRRPCVCDVGSLLGQKQINCGGMVEKLLLGSGLLRF